MANSKKHMLLNRDAMQTLAVLLGGFVIIQIAAIFVFTTYFHFIHQTPTIGQVRHDVIRVIRISQVISTEQLTKQSELLSEPGMQVKVAPKPVKGAQLIFTPDLHLIAKLIDQHPFQLRLALPLTNGQWLNITTQRVQHGWLFTGFLSSLIILGIVVVFLCVWAVRRFALPLDQFAKAADEFGRDMDAPPIAVSGSPSMRKLIKAFNQMQARVRRLLRDRTQMLAAISHDLRTPITRLKLRAEYIEDKAQYDKVIADLDEMEHMITSILAFAREQNLQEPKQKFDLNALLESICDEQQDVGHDVVFHGLDRRLAFSGRMVALKRAFNNLISNAIKYGQKANVMLAVKPSQVQIIVEDEGPGIPEEQLEKVFAPFYRVDQARSLKISGAGLGLAVARDIIRQHGGDIDLVNLPTRGLKVIVELPVTAI